MTEINQLVQNDFSGGINLVDDPSELAPNQVVECTNAYIENKRLVQRGGMTAYNTTAIGAYSVRGVTQFLNKKGTYTLVTEASDNKVYAGSSEISGTGTFTSILTETSGVIEPCFTVVDGKLFYTNGSDAPQIYEGTYGRCQGCLVVSTSVATYVDYEDVASDESTVTTIPLYGLSTTVGTIYVGSRVPKVKGIRFVVSGVNTSATTMTVTGWNGSSFAAVSGFSDGTSVGGVSLAQTGDVTFTEFTLSPTLINYQYRYWFKITFTANLSSLCAISGIYLMYDMQPLKQMWDGTLENCSEFNKTVDNGATYTDYTTNVTDGDATTVATLSSLDTLANGDWFIVGHTTRFEGVYFDVSATNSTTATLAVHYWDGDSWEALTVQDNTSSGGATLATDGYVWFALPTSWQPHGETSLGLATYQLRFTVDAAIDASVTISEVDVVPTPDDLEVFSLCINFKNRLVLANAFNNKGLVRISEELMPWNFYGSDSEELNVPIKEPITALQLFYNELFIGCVDQVFLLEGYSPATFGLLRIESGNVGPVNNRSVVSYDKYLFFPHPTGIYRFDGTQVEGPVTDNVQNYFKLTDTTYGIKNTNFKLICGRYNKTRRAIEWAVAVGSGASANTHLICLNVDSWGWTVQQYGKVPTWLGTISGQYGDYYLYSGSSDGRLYLNETGNQDSGTDITTTVVTRGYSTRPAETDSFLRIRAKALTQASGTVAVSRALEGATSFTSLGSMSFVRSGYSYVWDRLTLDSGGTSLQLKFVHSTSNLGFTLLATRIDIVPVRTEVVSG